MESATFVDLIPSLALGIGLAACAGLRAWLPLLLTGGLARVGYLELGDRFQFLSSNRALVLFAVATVIEIAGDKIPAVDHALDSLSTILRPAAGSLLAASVLWQISDPLTAAVLGIAIGAPSALVPHAAKTVLRTASTVFTGGLANPLISILEDVLALAMFALTVVVPVLMALVVAVAAWLVVRKLAARRAAVRTAAARGASRGRSPRQPPRSSRCRPPPRSRGRRSRSGSRPSSSPSPPWSRTSRAGPSTA